jgi:hypothetical protein
VTLALVAVCVVAVVVGAGSAVWRRVADERRSVADYHRTLDTLRRVEGSRASALSAPPSVGRGPDVRAPATPPSSAARPAGDRGAGLSTGGERWRPTWARSSADEPTVAVPLTGTTPPAAEARGSVTPPTGPSPRLVFDDLARPEPLAPAPVRDGPEAQGLAGDRRGSRGSAPRLLQVATGAVAAVVVAGLVVLFTVPRHHGSTSRERLAARREASAGSASGTGSTAGKPAAHHKSRVSTPAPQVVVPTSATRYQGTVTVPAGSYQVDVSVTAPCWVEATETTTGTDVWSGVLTAGESHLYTLSGPVLLEIGAADASLTIDGTPVALPTGYQVPYDLHLQPAA